MRIRTLTIGALILAVAFIAAMPVSSQAPFTLDNLVGDWDGVGWAVLPMVGARLDIVGTLAVTPDSTGRNYITELHAEKFMVTYNATGLVVPDRDSDSLTWTVRDSFKRTSQYRGLVEETGISGRMEYGSKVYTFSLAQTAVDTMRVVIHRTDVKSTETEQIGELVLTPSVTLE